MIDKYIEKNGNYLTGRNSYIFVDNSKGDY